MDRISSLGAVLFDLRCQLRRRGARELLRALPQKLRARFRSEERLIVLCKDLEDVPEPAFEGDLVVEDLDARHLPALYELNRRRCETRANARFARDVERGYRGYVAFREGELVGYYWWVDGSAAVPHPDIASRGLGIRLGEGDVYGSDYFMLEQHRGRGSAVDFIHKIESDLARRGYRRLWGYVVSTNRPARWLYSSRRYEPMWTVSRRTDWFRRRTATEPSQATRGTDR